MGNTLPSARQSCVPAFSCHAHRLRPRRSRGWGAFCRQPASVVEGVDPEGEGSEHLRLLMTCRPASRSKANWSGTLLCTRAVPTSAVLLALNFTFGDRAGGHEGKWNVKATDSKFLELPRAEARSSRVSLWGREAER